MPTPEIERRNARYTGGISISRESVASVLPPMDRLSRRGVTLLRLIQLFCAFLPIAMQYYFLFMDALYDNSVGMGATDWNSKAKVFSAAVMRPIYRDFVGAGYFMAWFECLYSGYLLTSRLFFPPSLQTTPQRRASNLPPTTTPILDRTGQGMDKVYLRKQFAIIFIDFALSWSNLGQFSGLGIPAFVTGCSSMPFKIMQHVSGGRRDTSYLEIEKCYGWIFLMAVSGFVVPVYALSAVLTGVRLWDDHVKVLERVTLAQEAEEEGDDQRPLPTVGAIRLPEQGV